MGDQNCPMRSVVPPFGDEQPQMRIRFAFVDFGNGRTPLNAPKKSVSSVAFGAHLPSTGPALNVKLMRVLRTSPSLKSLSVVGWLAGAAANSAFCPWPNPPNSPLFVNIVALMKPLIVSVSPSPSFTTCPVGCWAGAERAPARTEITNTASPQNDATPFLMTSPSCEKVDTRHPGAPS